MSPTESASACVIISIACLASACIFISIACPASACIFHQHCMLSIGMHFISITYTTLAPPLLKAELSEWQHRHLKSGGSVTRIFVTQSRAAQRPSTLHHLHWHRTRISTTQTHEPPQRSSVHMSISIFHQHQHLHLHLHSHRGNES